MSDREPEEIQIWPQPTPNPKTIRFITNHQFLDWGSRDFPDAKSSRGNPLPEALFGLKGVDGVMIGTNFVSITEGPDADWNTLGGEVMTAVRDHILSGVDAVAEEEEKAVSGDQGEIAQKIIEILDREIRPAVAMDGGDIIFREFKDGIVTLTLLGACHGCPSSTATLRMGIEERLRTAIPEVKEVVAA